MRRRTLGVSLAVITAMSITALSATPAGADGSKSGGCPPGEWTLEDPAGWLDATKAGIAAEGSTMEEQAALFGFAGDVAGFEQWIIAGVFGEEGADSNGDGRVCRGTNSPNGYPQFYFKVTDNKFHPKFVG